MLTLSLEAASTSLYLAVKGDGLLVERSLDNLLHHDGALLTFINETLESIGHTIRDVSLLVLGEGPGSFTSLRIASSLFKGFSLSLDIPIVSVSTLDALSKSVEAYTDRNTLVAPLIDARMNRFYTAFYENGQRITEDKDISFEELVGFTNKNILLVPHPLERERVRTLLPHGIMEKEKRRVLLAPSFLLFNPAVALIEQAKGKEADRDGKGPKYVREHSGLIKYNT